jgi:hypothetical protein
VRPAGVRLGHSTFDHTAGIKTSAETGEQRRAPAVAAYGVLGAIVWASPLELGTLGLLLTLAILVAIAAVHGSTANRLQRVGAYLVGGSIGGPLLLLSAILRVRNVCAPGGQVQTPTGTSYACYPVETLWFFLPYVVLAFLGALMLFLARKRLAS